MKRRLVLIVFALGMAVLANSCSLDLSSFNNRDDDTFLEQTPMIAALPISEPTATPILSDATTSKDSQVVTESADVDSVVTDTMIDEANTRMQGNDIVSVGESYIYAVQLGSPVAMPNWSHPERGCNWLGVVGQVFGQESLPDLGVIIEVGGSIGEQEILGLSITGVTDLYGPGSFEIKLADHTIATHEDIWIQVKGTSGEALSPQIYFDTYADCAQNLILINFIKVEPYIIEYKVYLPLIIHETP